VDDWVNAHEPDLVFLEAVVNDGDSVLETGDEAGVRRAVEGIVRQIKSKHPRCDIVLVHMLLRGDLPSSRRTGTRAWVRRSPLPARALHYVVWLVFRRSSGQRARKALLGVAGHSLALHWLLLAAAPLAY